MRPTVVTQRGRRAGRPGGRRLRRIPCRCWVRPHHDHDTSRTRRGPRGRAQRRPGPDRDSRPAGDRARPGRHLTANPSTRTRLPRQRLAWSRVPLPGQAPSRRQGRRPLPRRGAAGRSSRRRTSWACAGSEEQYGVEVVEYPTTRKISPPAARAADVNAAFADPDITAILTSIGGDDQIKILKHLDADVIPANPKPFFGISDNTQPAQLPLEPRDRVLLRRHGDDRPRPRRRRSTRTRQRRSAPRSSGTAGTTCGRRRRSPTSTGTGPTRRTSSSEPEMLPGTGWSWHGGHRRTSSRARCGAAASRSSTSTCAPGVTSRRTTRRTTGACCTSRPPRSCPPRSTSARCSCAWASAACCNGSRRC